ncbi:hypothetical protein LCGC14_3104860 [marine sediment metagenome]|uniref:Uncharacterized protein n=1 Tax=marine sediment metagenome TaxID=412755 RepID=A0A0F8W6T3_9ZZZZ
MQAPELLWIILWDNEAGTEGSNLAGPYKSLRAAEQAAEDMLVKYRRATSIYGYELATAQAQETAVPHTVTHEDSRAAGQRASDDKVLLWSVRCFQCETLHNVSSDDQAYFPGAQQICPPCVEAAREEARS